MDRQANAGDCCPSGLNKLKESTVAIFGLGGVGGVDSYAAEALCRVILGSVSFIPSIFGLTMAGVVVNDLLTAGV